MEDIDFKKIALIGLPIALVIGAGATWLLLEKPWEEKKEDAGSKTKS